MAVNSVNNNNRNKYVDVATKSLAGGIIASEAYRLTLPKAVKLATNGEDYFVAKHVKAAEKTFKNLAKKETSPIGEAAKKYAQENGLVKNIEQIAQNAKEEFAFLSGKAKKANKTTNLILAGVTAALFTGAVIADKAIQAKNAKAEAKTEENNQ